MSKGYVYILSNPSMPGIVKIGKTARSVHQRAQELWQTGVPQPFKVEYEVTSPDCAELEMRAHNKFHGSRVSESREFFRAEVVDIARYLEGEQRYQVEILVEEFIPDQLIVDADSFIDPGAFCSSVYSTLESYDMHPLELINALCRVEGGELIPAIQRYLNIKKNRIEERQKNKALKVVGEE